RCTSEGYNAMADTFRYAAERFRYAAESAPMSAAPFRFEDLPVNDDGQRLEPESWGPVYDIKRKRGQDVGDAVREAHTALWKRDPVFHTNSPSGQAFEFSVAKHRARMKAEFTAAANRDRLAWATSKDIAVAYDEAMAAKRARLAKRAAGG